MSKLSAFFASSPIARTIRPSSCIVLKRTKLSARELAEIKTNGVYQAGRVDTNTCELEVGGKVIARGKIVRRRGKSFFQVTSTEIQNSNEEKSNE